MNELTFSEIEIQKLFGHEAAEDEDPSRLREYYFKSNTYDQVVTKLPLRILVGHKGIGKSALFQIAMQEDIERHDLPVLIKPDDIVGLASGQDDFLKIIRDWKQGLIEIVTRKVLATFGSEQTDVSSKLKKFGGQTLDYLKDTFNNFEKVNYSPTKCLIIDRFLKKGKVFVYIDDLDRGWEGRLEDIKRISALLNAARDIVKEHKGIQIKISLRSDVYFLSRTSDESTDKIEGSVVWQSWTNHEILALLVKRIETFFGRNTDESKLVSMDQHVLSEYLIPIMEKRFSGRGHWENAPMHRVLMSLIRKRPRDLVKLCTLAARDARKMKNKIITTVNFEHSFESYSHGRLQDTFLEFRSELPEIQRLLMNMKPNKRERQAKAGFLYKTDELLKKISNIQEMGGFTFTNGRLASTKELAAFLYKINFLTARKDTATGIIRKYFEENRFLSSDFTDFGFDWEVHPAYRWALQPSDLFDIYNNVEISKL